MRGLEVDVTDTGSCSTARSAIGDVESSDSATREFVTAVLV
jgi:hypothetical protein